MGMRTTMAAVLSAALVACGSDSRGGGPPPAGTGGTGGGNAGSGGGSGATATGGAGGAAGAGGVAGTAGSNGGTGGGTGGSSAGTLCTQAPSGDLWTRMAGSYSLVVSLVGGGAEAYFPLGSSHQVEVSPSSCSLTFHGTGQSFTCVWGNPAEQNKAEEHAPSKGWLIQIGAIEQWNSPTPGCQVHGGIDPDRLDAGFLYLPGQSTPSTFAIAPP